MWEDSLTQPCIIIANLQNILKIHLADLHHAPFIWRPKTLINVFDNHSSGLPS